MAFWVSNCFGGKVGQGKDLIGVDSWQSFLYTLIMLKKHILIRLTPDQHRALRQYCLDNDTNAQRLVIELLKGKLEA